MLIHEWDIDGWTIRMELVQPYEFAVSYQSPSEWWGSYKEGLSEDHARDRFHDLVRRFLGQPTD